MRIGVFVCAILFVTASVIVVMLLVDWLVPAPYSERSWVRAGAIGALAPIDGILFNAMLRRWDRLHGPRR